MPDWVFDALESFQAFMDEASLADVALMLVISALGAGLVVAMHEAGHALAALLTGNRVQELRVGDADDVTVVAGSLRVRLGRLRDDADVAGYVIFDGRSATPRQLLAIALAGPAANLLGAALSAPLALRADGMRSVVLFLWTFASLATAIGNLQPSGDPHNPARWSDGRWAQVAWAARRRPILPSMEHGDPNAATSVPPPAS